MKEYEKIKQILAAIEEDVIKFSEKGNAAAEHAFVKVFRM